MEKSCALFPRSINNAAERAKKEMRRRKEGRKELLERSLLEPRLDVRSVHSGMAVAEGREGRFPDILFSESTEVDGGNAAAAASA